MTTDPPDAPCSGATIVTPPAPPPGMGTRERSRGQKAAWSCGLPWPRTWAARAARAAMRRAKRITRGSCGADAPRAGGKSRGPARLPRFNCPTNGEGAARGTSDFQERDLGFLEEAGRLGIALAQARHGWWVQ
jgi:hypothetical protein